MTTDQGGVPDGDAGAGSPGASAPDSSAIPGGAGPDTSAIPGGAGPDTSAIPGGAGPGAPPAPSSAAQPTLEAPVPTPLPAGVPVDPVLAAGPGPVQPGLVGMPTLGSQPGAPYGGAPDVTPGDPSGPTADAGTDPGTEDEPPAQVPATAAGRLGSGTFSSDLSVADFAACLEVGMEPVGFVQGFDAMRLANYTSAWRSMSMMGGGVGLFGTSGGMPPGFNGYYQRWNCPHGYYMSGNDHRPWGANYEIVPSEAAWSAGFGRAYARMLDEARDAGAHGVIGVTNQLRPMFGGTVHEFHLTGTAVRIAGAEAPATPFTTYLSGQRLVKLIEAGFMPVSIVSTLVSVGVYASCVTVWASEGQGYSYQPGEITQVSAAVQSAVDLANARVAATLEGDILHGASMECGVREGGGGDRVIECTLHGNRVRRFRPFDPMDLPRPTVSLSR
ncbi:MAG: hypothetical protein M0Z62_05800 [Actinomycetota bacterium]|nr:hypothetical protein [Actinomycetota bacterium]